MFKVNHFTTRVTEISKKMSMKVTWEKYCLKDLVIRKFFIAYQSHWKSIIINFHLPHFVTQTNAKAPSWICFSSEADISSAFF